MVLIEQPAGAPELNPAERVFEELRHRIEGPQYATIEEKVRRWRRSWRRSRQMRNASGAWPGGVGSPQPTQRSHYIQPLLKDLVLAETPWYRAYRQIARHPEHWATLVA